MFKPSVLKIKETIELDSAEEFYSAYQEYVKERQGLTHTSDIENGQWCIIEMIKNHSIKCYEKLIDTGFEFGQDHLEHLHTLEAQLRWDTEDGVGHKVLNMIELIINKLNVDVNSLDIYEHQYMRPHFHMVMSIPEALSIYLKNGLDLDKIVQINHSDGSTTSLPLDKALEQLYIESNLLAVQESLILVQTFKTAKEEKQELERLLVKNSSVHKIEKI